jgi:hypothetical protein
MRAKQVCYLQRSREPLTLRHNGLCNRCRRLDYISPVSIGSWELLHRGLSRREEIWIPCCGA